MRACVRMWVCGGWAPLQDHINIGPEHRLVFFDSHALFSFSSLIHVPEILFFCLQGSNGPLCGKGWTGTHVDAAKYVHTSVRERCAGRVQGWSMCAVCPLPHLRTCWAHPYLNYDFMGPTHI